MIITAAVGWNFTAAPTHAEQANTRVYDTTELGYGNVEVRQGDGYHGWVEHAPYDGIIVTAAAPNIPHALTDQLRDGARLVIPVGEAYGPQRLLVVTKHAGKVDERIILPVAFVPLRHSSAGRPTALH